jgi:tetratricopeptide (TPR) repeat protein
MSWHRAAHCRKCGNARPARRHTTSLEAYDHFLRAQALFLARGARENVEARELYRRAVEVDPRFARAYAGLAMTYAMEGRLTGGAAGALDRALALAQTAREIDPDIAEVQWALGFVHTQARRYPQALESLQRTIDLNPSFADAHALMGGIHTYIGEPAKSIPLLRTAMRLQPEGGYLYFLLLGRAYFFEGDMEQALVNLRAAAVRNPADVESRLYIAAAFVESGNRQAAEWEAEEIRALERGFSPRKWLASYPLASEAHRARLRQALATLFDDA